MADTHRRIHNKGPYQHEEYKAGEAGIYPGMLLNLNSDGDVVKHATAEVQAVVMLAEEDALQGEEVSDVYTDDTEVMCILPGKGSVVNCLVALGENIAIGDYLCSAGDGTFIEVETATSGTLNAGVLVQATESSSGALAANTLIACRVL
jgi:hypothetical protein